jgi:transposase
MKMPYTKNPYLPKLRAQAVEMVRAGKSVRAVARYYGVSPSTVCKWNQKVPDGGCYYLETLSCRPHSHPNQLERKIVDRIVELRIKTGRCAEVLHKMITDEGISISLSSVKRILKREGMIKERSPWKRYHKGFERPLAVNPGDLVQIDTIHKMVDEKSRIYVYTLIDLYSRWAFAKATELMNSKKTVLFVNGARKLFPFDFKCLQSDHGPEFSTHFSERIKIQHRHSRVRRPNDNAHLERFNRTLQDELLNKLPVDVRTYNKALPEYLSYYNNERLHLGIGLKTPNQILSKCFQGID